jgi:Mrp family chromosome partitioning ATPase/capsular polysaccharide biosynthesis protein
MLARRWPIVLVLAVLGGVAGWMTTPEAAEAGSYDGTVYEATNISFLSSDQPTGLTPAQIAFMVTFEDVPELAAERLDEDRPGRLADQVKASYDETLAILQITSTSPDPDEAERVADAFAGALRDYLSQQASGQQTRQIEGLTERIRILEEEIAALNAEIPTAGANLDIVLAERESAAAELRGVRANLQELRTAGPPPSGIRSGREARALPYKGPGLLELALDQLGATAEEEEEDSGGGGGNNDDEAQELAEAREALRGRVRDEPDPVMRAGLGAGAGLFVGLAIVALMASLDTRVRTRADAEVGFGLPVLVEVPALSRKHRNDLVVHDLPDSQAAESYRSLRTSLALARLPGTASTGDGDALERDVRVIMASAPEPGDGASTVAANLAAALAEARMTVLVVDCDFRRPRMAELLDADGTAPLGGITESDLDDVSTFTAETSVPGVWMARSVDEEGSPQLPPAELIAAQRAFVAAARSQFDVVIIDTAPSLSANDASDLLPVVDAVLFAARTGQTSRPGASRSVEQFERLSAPMAGVVLLDSAGSSAPRRSDGAYTAGPRPTDHNGKSRGTVVDVTT